jgi:hypothetical protein
MRFGRNSGWWTAAIVGVLIGSCAGWNQATAADAPPQGVEAYSVVWDTPSQNYGGSMPLGNGDIGVNLWVEADGDLQFFISKTDAWDDNARLVKVGKVRVRFEPNPFAANQSFCQTLSLRDGTVKIQAGEGDRQTVIQVWVDANQPAIHATTESSSPIQTTAAVELWRTEPKPYTDLQVSDIMVNRKLPGGQQEPTIIEPDTVLTGQQGRIGWYHHNVKSVGPKLLAEVQGLTGFSQPDPLLHRTFGAVITAEHGERLDDLQLRCPPATKQRLNVFVLTRHPATPDEWLAEMDQTIARVEAGGFDVGRAAHERWWEAFWERSWIRAAVRPGAEAAADSGVPANEHLLRLGQDQSGGSRHAGELARVSVFGRGRTACCSPATR